MKNFIHHDIPSIKRINKDGSRFYETPTGNAYPSVTSVLGHFKSKHIQAWRERVGEEEAGQITRRASNRGTSIHSLCEDYIMGKDPVPSPFHKEMFESIKPVIDQFDNIHGLETQMFSHHLEVAGTVDLIAEYEGRLHIIDYKTSTKAKRREWIHDYFMQASAYAVMFEELTNIPVGRLMIVIGLDEPGEVCENLVSPQLQVFTERRDDWIGEFVKVRKEYKRIKGV